MWELIWAGVAQEFSDLPNITDTTRLVIRSLLAAGLGGLIGLERERSGKAAGVRTHMLVCIGTAYFIAIPELAGFEDEQLSRIIQGIAAGVGFIGAGSILKFESEKKVQGITTAASIWFTAAIGVSIGLGREGSAFLGTVIALVVLALVPHPRD